MQLILTENNFFVSTVFEWNWESITFTIKQTYLLNLPEKKKMTKNMNDDIFILFYVLFILRDGYAS